MKKFLSVLLALGSISCAAESSEWSDDSFQTDSVESSANVGSLSRAALGELSKLPKPPGRVIEAKQSLLPFKLKESRVRTLSSYLHPEFGYRVVRKVVDDVVVVETISKETYRETKEYLDKDHSFYKWSNRAALATTMGCFGGAVAAGTCLPLAFLPYTFGAFYSTALPRCDAEEQCAGWEIDFVQEVVNHRTKAFGENGFAYALENDLLQKTILHPSEARQIFQNEVTYLLNEADRLFIEELGDNEKATWLKRAFSANSPFSTKGLAFGHSELPFESWLKLHEISHRLESTLSTIQYAVQFDLNEDLAQFEEIVSPDLVIGKPGSGIGSRIRYLREQNRRSDRLNVAISPFFDVAVEELQAFSKKYQTLDVSLNKQ